MLVFVTSSEALVTTSKALDSNSFVTTSKALVTTSVALVTTSKALVTTSVALVTSKDYVGEVLNIYRAVELLDYSPPKWCYEPSNLQQNNKV